MKITLNDVTNIDSITTINDNFDKIEQALQNQVLYRNNPSGEPNTVESAIDLNGQDLLNVGRIGTGDGDIATTDYLDSVTESVEALAVQVSENAALSLDYKDEAFAAAVESGFIFDQFRETYLGTRGSDPTVSNTGGPLQAGMLYFLSSGTPVMRVYNGSTWQDTAGISSSSTSTIDSGLYANLTEAQDGTNNTKVMTPQRVKDAISHRVLNGATLTGPLVLPGNAAANLQATPLQQVNALITTAVDAAVAAITVSSQSGRLLRVLRYTTSGTFVKQAGENTVEVTVIGGGGPSIDTNGCHGGGAGGTAIKRFDASSLAVSVPVIVGTGGSYPTVPATASSFNGVSGYPGSLGDQTNPGFGGEASGGDLNIKGGSSGGYVPNSFLRTTGWCVYGSGGNSTLGGGAPGFFVAASSVVFYDGAPNTGGGGSGPGGRGGSGYVEIRTYS